ncbi:MAG: peptidoglycan recognition protein family protein [bacterium]|nr:peptidoglycan recognition protein family protein [bacterium]
MSQNPSPRTAPAAPSNIPSGSSSVRAALALLLAFAAAACAGPRYLAPPPLDPVNVPATVSASAIFARPTHAAGELERLPRAGSVGPGSVGHNNVGHNNVAVQLRRAFLELELGRTRAAIDATSQVLYGTSKPSANEEAFARYLRGLAYVKAGTPRLARFDLDRARELAMDPGLRRRILDLREPPRRGSNTVASLGVRQRSTWRAATANPRRLDRMDRATRITVHHSAVYFRSMRPAATAAQLQRIQKDHMGGRGYGDIGYHYLVDPAGRIWQGRDMRWQGAHASGRNNVRNVGVCVLGNFVRGGNGHQPTPRQVEALRDLLGALMNDHGIPAQRIHRHSDFKATACPGPLLEPVLAQLVHDLTRQPLRVATPTP